MKPGRALMREADLKRAAKVAREERVAVSVELPDGTKFKFDGASVATLIDRPNGFDDAL